MSDGYKTAYGLEISGERLLLARAVRRGVPQSVCGVALDSEEAHRALQTVADEVKNGVAALAVCAPATKTVIRRLRLDTQLLRLIGLLCSIFFIRRFKLRIKNRQILINNFLIWFLIVFPTSAIPPYIAHKTKYYLP